jgi:hypothetical protein
MPLAGEPQPAPADDMFLIQSSYSRVFGLIGGNGRWMYTADANHQREQYFDLTAGSPFAKALNATDRLQYRKWVLDRLDLLDRHYRPRED